MAGKKVLGDGVCRETPGEENWRRHISKQLFQEIQRLFGWDVTIDVAAPHPMIRSGFARLDESRRLGVMDYTNSASSGSFSRFLWL